MKNKIRMENKDTSTAIANACAKEGKLSRTLHELVHGDQFERSDLYFVTDKDGKIIDHNNSKDFEREAFEAHSFMMNFEVTLNEYGIRDDETGLDKDEVEDILYTNYKNLPNSSIFEEVDQMKVENIFYEKVDGKKYNTGGCWIPNSNQKNKENQKDNEKIKF